MILQQVLALIEARRVIGVSEIAAEVGSSTDAVRSMLSTLQRRGLVHRHEAVQGCGSTCHQCAQAEVELYGPGPAPVLQVAACSSRDH